MMIMLPGDRNQRIKFLANAMIKSIGEFTKYDSLETTEILMEMLKELVIRTNQGEREGIETAFLEMIGALKDEWAKLDEIRIKHTCDNCDKECDCMHLLCKEKECKACECTLCTSCINKLNKTSNKR